MPRLSAVGISGLQAGEGLEREIELLAPARVTLLGDRHLRAPYGLPGGAPGPCGRHLLRRADTVRELPGKTSFEALAGDRLTVVTPGGGGWGEEDGT